MSGGALTRVLEDPRVYLIWQGPFIRQKIAPVLADIQLDGKRRILDIGCGPGTNAEVFASEREYVGVDLSAEYVAHAKQKYGRPFFVCDVTRDPLPEGPFDVVLINSLMHHLSDSEVGILLKKALAVLAPEGVLQIVDLVLPPVPSLSRFLALRDRGEYPRPFAAWRALFSQHFAVERCEEFNVGLIGVSMWRLVHVRGRRA